MTKKHFIALADELKDHNRTAGNVSHYTRFTDDQTKTLATFCAKQNPNFDRERWLGYIAGTNGKNGGKV